MLRLRLVFIIALLSMICPALATSQNVNSGTNSIPLLSPKAPFEAEETIREYHKLDDGTVISREFIGRVARDSEGRYRRELRKTMNAGQARSNEKTTVTLIDPIKGQELHWASDSKNGTVFFLDPKTAPTEPLLSLGKLEMDFYVQFNGKAIAEELGQKSINGLKAVGVRTTGTVETGKVGNDRPLEFTREVWTSTELNVVLLEKLHNPLMGDLSLEVKNVRRVEADAALFRAPDDYQFTGSLVKGGIIGSQTVERNK